RRAVALASAAAGESDEELTQKVTEGVTEKLKASGADPIDIEKIQDTVEETLFEHKCYRTAKAYILYRIEKEKERTNGSWKEGLLSREFLSPYKHAPNP
ncbi:protein containing ATP-cone domain protein, partial [gut metagenome]